MDFKRRLKRIEKKMQLMDKGNEVKTIILEYVYSRCDEPKDMPPEPVEEWLTYKEQLGNEPHNGFRFIHLDPIEELKARERLQKVTEGNKNE